MRVVSIEPKRAGALAHQCPSCRRHWALQLVDHPAGLVAMCRYCFTVRGAVPSQAPAPGDTTSAPDPALTRP
ncbi:MAG TPA: hypothetical protein VI452_18585 [Marmoricola sp.]